MNLFDWIDENPGTYSKLLFTLAGWAALGLVASIVEDQPQDTATCALAVIVFSIIGIRHALRARHR